MQTIVPKGGESYEGPWAQLPLWDPTYGSQKRRLHELLAAVDVVGRAGERAVGHQVQGQRGDVAGPDHAPDGQGRAQLFPAVVELVPEQLGGQGRGDQGRGERVAANRGDLPGGVGARGR